MLMHDTTVGNKMIDYYCVFQTYRDFFTNIPHTNAVTLIASVICMVFLYTIKTYINQNPKIKPRLKMPVPVELIAVSVKVKKH